MNEKLNAAIEEAKKEFQQRYPSVYGSLYLEFLSEKIEQAYALGMDAGAESAARAIEGCKVLCLKPHSLEEQANMLPYCQHVQERNSALDEAVEVARTAHKV